VLGKDDWVISIKLDLLFAIVGAIAAFVSAAIALYLILTLGLRGLYIPNTPLGWLFVVSVFVFILSGIAITLIFLRRDRSSQ